MLERSMPSGADHDPFYGDPTHRASSLLGKVKGNLFQSRRRYVEERWGGAAMDEVLATMDDEAARAIRSPPPKSAWIDLATLVAVDRVITDRLMDGDVAQMQQFGARIAQYDFEKTYANILRIVTSARFFVARAPTLFALYFQDDRRLRAAAQDRAGEVRLERGVLPRYMCRYGITGWLEAALTFYKVRTVELEHARCRHDGDARCEWHLRWE